MTEDSAVWLDDHQQRVWRLWLEVSTTLPAVLNRQLSRDSQLSVQDFEVLVRLSETDGGDMRVVALAEHMDGNAPDCPITSRVWRSEASSNVASAVRTAEGPSFTSLIRHGGITTGRPGPRCSDPTRRFFWWA